MKPKRPRVVINVVLFNRVSYATVWHQIIIVIITSGQEASKVAKTATKCDPSTLFQNIITLSI